MKRDFGSFSHINTSMQFGFDIISDLYLTEDDEFDWSDKPTSLYCLVVGNITSDLDVLHKFLRHLSTFYQGVFFIDGNLESPLIFERDSRIVEITKICETMQNVVYLHSNVVVVDGIALIGVNGWYGNFDPLTDDEKFHVKSYRFEDIVYLEKTIERLQLHVDVKKIVIVSNSIPSEDFCYHETEIYENDITPQHTLIRDTEGKVIHWVFGSYKKVVDVTKDNINYVNNPCYGQDPYYAKRITVAL